MSSLSFFLKEFLGNLVGEVMAERTALWWYQPWNSHLYLLNLPKTLNLNSPQELLAHGGNCQNPIGSVKIELK